MTRGELVRRLGYQGEPPYRPHRAQRRPEKAVHDNRLLTDNRVFLGFAQKSCKFDALFVQSLILHKNPRLRCCQKSSFVSGGPIQAAISAWHIIYNAEVIGTFLSR